MRPLMYQYMDDVTKIAYSGGGVRNPENFAYVLYGWPLI